MPGAHVSARAPEKRRADWARHAAETNAKRRAKWTAEKDAKNAARAAKYREGRPDLPPYKPMPPRGPMSPPDDPYVISEGHELSGLSSLVGPDGATRMAWHKTRVAGADPEPLPEGFSPIPVRVSRMSRGDGQQVIEWASYKPEEIERDAAMRAAWARHAEVYAGLAAPVAAPAFSDADLVTLYPLGDPHIGMLSWAPETGDHFDAKIACRELLECVRLMVEAAPPSSHAIVCNLGDFLHAQDESARTPGHGNQLDVDGRYPKLLDMGHVLLRGIVDLTLAKHQHVTKRNLPGNHDPRVAAELMYWLRAVYEREPRVTVADAFAAHQYDRFGSCLFGWHHGDRTKASELPAIMATDRASDWGQTTERVWHVGHVHHLTRVETPGCVVETHRTMAGRDAWHAGRYRAQRSLQAITYHREYGEVSRVTVGLERVRHALKKGRAS
jgi:hypothetical protein